MTNPHIPIVDLPAAQMDAESMATLSYIFCQGEHFDSFTGLYCAFMAGLPDERRIMKFWQEVEELGWG